MPLFMIDKMATKIDNVRYKKVANEGKTFDQDLEESPTTNSEESPKTCLDETPIRKRSRRVSDYGALNTTNLNVLFDESNDDQGDKTPTNLLEEKKYVHQCTQTDEPCNESVQLLNNSLIRNPIIRQEKNTNCEESFKDLIFLSPALMKRVASTPLVMLKFGTSIEDATSSLCTPKVDLNINDASKFKNINKDSNIRLDMNNVTNTEHRPAAVALGVMSCLTSCAPIQSLRSKLGKICGSIKGKVRSKVQEFLRDDDDRGNDEDKPKCVAECREIMHDLKILLERLSKIEYEKLKSNPHAEDKRDKPDEDKPSMLSSIPPPPPPPPPAPLPPPPPPPPLPPSLPKSPLKRSQSLKLSSESKSRFLNAIAEKPMPRIALEDIKNVKLKKVSDRRHHSLKRVSQPNITKDMLEQVQLKPPKIRTTNFLTPDAKENMSMSPHSSLCRTLLAKSEGSVKRLQKVKRMNSSYKRSLLTTRDNS